MSNYYVTNGELYHHGVKGMKWGVRKKQYNKDFNKASKYSRRHPISQYISKTARAESDKRWDRAIASAGKSNETARAYKNAKAEYKQTRKQGKSEFKTFRKIVSSSRSTGAKLATNVLAGPFANRTYNSVIAAGGSRTGARVVTALTSYGGPLAHLAVSALYTSAAGDKKTQNALLIKRSENSKWD